MSPQVTIFELIEKDLEGATIVVGFPGVGLVGTIAANHLINSQGLEQIGVVESPHFPAVSVVKDGVPHNPVRTCAKPHTGAAAARAGRTRHWHCGGDVDGRFRIPSNAH